MPIFYSANDFEIMLYPHDGGEVRAYHSLAAHWLRTIGPDNTKDLEQLRCDVVYLPDRTDGPQLEAAVALLKRLGVPQLLVDEMERRESGSEARIYC